ncbi:MAG: hypothetical protein EOP87_06445, partial [Verrucomicrobiaceae bacterium]
MDQPIQESAAAPAPVPDQKKRPWALTVFGLAAIGGLVAMPFLAGPPDGDKMPDMVRFLGHFHPVLLHLPIGVFSLIALQETGAIFLRKRGERRETPLFPMFFGALSCIVAVIAGFLLYHGGGYEGNELAERHLWGGLAFAVASVLVLIVKAWTLFSAANQAFYRLLFFSNMGIMSFASHDGASITHGSDYLTSFAPDPIRKLLGLPVKNKKGTGEGGTEEKVVSPEQKVVYADIIAPIFENRCNQCHKEEKSKGKLRMDTYDMLIKGGKEGPSIEPGSAEKSNIIVRMSLPLDEDEHMPPDGKPEPEPHEVVLIKWWLDGGADPKKTVGEMGEIPAPVKEALAKLPSNHSAVMEEVAAKKTAGPSDDLKLKLAELQKEFPNAVRLEALQSSNVIFTAVSMKKSLDDATFAKFSPLFPQLVEADLSGTIITDASVAKLSAAPELKKLRLAETAITDASIDTLVKLGKLESLNLYGTKVTNAGVLKLAALPELKSLYL